MDTGDLRQDVETCLDKNREAVDRIAAAFVASGGDPADLDEFVLDLAGGYGADEANLTDVEDEQEAAISAAESQASDVNNEGVEMQVAAVLLGHGLEEGERLVMAEAGVAPATP